MHVSRTALPLYIVALQTRRVCYISETPIPPLPYDSTFLPHSHSGSRNPLHLCSYYDPFVTLCHWINDM